MGDFNSIQLRRSARVLTLSYSLIENSVDRTHDTQKHRLDDKIRQNYKLTAFLKNNALH